MEIPVDRFKGGIRNTNSGGRNRASLIYFGMFLFSTDIDGTIYDGPETAQRFADFWHNLKGGPEMPLLVYNSGRSVDDVRQLISSTELPDPDFIIGGVGTEVFDCSASCRMDEWGDDLEDSWDFSEVERIVWERAEGIERQPERCQNPYKSSWYWNGKSQEDLDLISRALEAEGLQAQIVYSSDRDLDILPTRANKGNAVAWLANRLGVLQDRIIVAGDSGNDSSMFSVEGGRGIVVANAEKALFNATARFNPHHSNLPCADGVIEGLRVLIPIS